MEKEMKVYHVETQDDYDELMIKLEELGCKWLGGEKPTEHDIWYKYKNNTLVIIKEDMTLRYGNKTYPKVQAIKYKTKGVEQMEKLVVPQFVVDWYEKFSNNSLGFKISELSHVSKRMEQWINSLETDYRCGLEIAQEVIAKMHLFQNYEVEQEKRYYWRKKKEYMFDCEIEDYTYLNIEKDTGVIYFSDKGNFSIHQTILTETQVKQAVSEEDFNKLERVEIDE